MKYLLTLLLSIGIGAVLIMAGVLPNQVNEEDFIHFDIKNTRVFTYKYGIAVYEKGSKLFYNVSPFDMYYREPSTSVFQKYINELPNKNSVFSWEDNLKSSQSAYNNVFKKSLRMLSYFGLNQPKATFTKDGKIAEIKVIKTAENMLTFVLNYSQINKESDLEMSLSLNEEDIFIDDKFNIYIPNEGSNINDYLSFKNKLGYQIKSYDDMPYALETKYLIISNPNMAGYFKINFEKGMVYNSIAAKRLNFLVSSDSPEFDLEVGDYLTERLSNKNVGL